MTPDRLRQIEELYHSAREYNPAERDGFLKDACWNDAELLREVESLLAQDDEGLLQQPLLQVAAAIFGEAGAQWAPGMQVGHYEISSLLGTGGTGEVYKAVDRRLGRAVAVKTVHEEFSGRFLREAQAISALNHPHICTVHDVGANYLVMEFLEGKTLAAALRNGRLPWELVLRYGEEIAEALAAAHSQGIIHRDLKPANVMITKAGVKVLDFGIAKFADRTAGTICDGTATERNMIVGTPAYMSPEQLRGEDCDTRSDIFALGLVLYEMASGRRAFEEASRADLIASIMGSQPPPLESVSPRFARIVERCLAKDVDNRLRSAYDVAVQLAWIQEDESRHPPDRRFTRAGNRDRLVWLLLILLLSVLALSRLRTSPAPPPTVEFSIPPPPGAQSFALDVAVAVSPDGSRLALRAVGANGNEMIWTRSMDSATLHPLPTTAGAMGFFWSPDNRSIAFISGNKLRKVDVNGGPAVDLCDSPMRGVNAGGTWGRDGTILLAPSGMDGLYRTSNSGAPVERVTNVDASRHEMHLGPQFFPDGRRFLFTVRSDGNRFATYLGSLDRKETRLLLQEASNAFYSRPRGSSQGYILFERKMLLMAQRFDENRQEVTGEVYVVSPKPLTYWRAFSTSENGTIAYRAGNPDTTLVWMDRSGRIVETLPIRGDYRQISLSPDGSSLAVGKMEQSASNVSHIWLIDLKRGTSSRLTSVPANNFCPVWSADGRRIVFSSNRDGPLNLYVRAASGDGGDELLLKSEAVKMVSSWSSDGRYLAYWFFQNKTKQDIWIVPSSGGKPFPFLETEFNELQPEFSPDGRWIAYTSDESGRQEVYVRRFEGAPATGGAIRISEDGGAHPKWRRNGRELFYLTPDRRLISVPIEISSRLHAGRAQPLFQTHVSMDDFLDNYAVSSDGQRILVNNSDEEAELGPVTVIANWSPGAKQ